MSNWEWVIIDLIICAFEVYMFFDLMKNKLKKTNSGNNSILVVLFMLWIYIYIVNTFGNIWLNISLLPLGLLVAVQILFWKDNFKHKCLIVLLFYVISQSVELCGGLISKRLFSIKEYEPLSTFILILFEKIIIFIIIKLIIRLNHQYSRIDNIIFCCFMTLPISTCLINLGMFIFSLYTTKIITQKIRFFFILGELGILISNSILFYIYEKHMEVLERSHTANLMIMKLKYNSLYYKSLAKKNEIFSSALHDFIIFVKTIEILALQNKVEKIVAMAQEQTHLIMNNTPIYCENVILNAILSANLESAKQENVNFELNIDPGFDCNFISDLDICTMIGNILENALEASKKCLSEKYIKCNFFSTKHQIVFKVSNSCVLDTIQLEGDRLLSSKRDNKFYGLGMKSVKEIVENKYDGIFNYSIVHNSISNNEFTAVIIINP